MWRDQKLVLQLAVSRAEREREKEEAKRVSKLTVTLAQFTCRKDAIGSRLLLLPEEALVSLGALTTSSQSWRDSSSIPS